MKDIKKQELINAFKTSVENKKYIEKLRDSMEFKTNIGVIVSGLLDLGIKAHKKKTKKSK